MVKPAERGENQQVVSASQPCLVDMNHSFPHLVKPNRVSDHAFQLRKHRLLQHKYEDIDIPEWTEVGVVPGSVTSVGDVPSPAVRNSWLEADKDNGKKRIIIALHTSRHTQLGLTGLFTKMSLCVTLCVFEKCSLMACGE